MLSKINDMLNRTNNMLSLTNNMLNKTNDIKSNGNYAKVYCKGDKNYYSIWTKNSRPIGITLVEKTRPNENLITFFLSENKVSRCIGSRIRVANISTKVIPMCREFITFMLL